MQLGTKEQLLQRPSLPTVDIELPELGYAVRVRDWTGADHDEFGAAVQGLKFDGAMFAAAIAVSAVDESGNRMFNLNGDIKLIASAWPNAALERVWDVVKVRNKLGKEGLEAAEKN